MVRPLYVRIVILLACEKHLHDRILLLREKIWAHKTNLIPPLFIEVSVNVSCKEIHV